MSSIALALKYRPTCFSDLVGQNAISQTLSLALDSQHISHAYLFSGLRGSGKTSSARIFARALQCESGPTSTPCGNCASCIAALQNKHMDIIEMDAASSRGIDDIKKVIEQTKYHPSFARYKIFIIDEVHMLSKEAFNALLKTLEEPPEFVKFILATTDPLKLPATILSRTQHFRFKQIPHRLIVEHIAQILNKEGVSYEPQALDIIARSGSGSLRDTLTLLDQAIIFCKNHIEVAGVTDMLGIVDPQVLNDYFQSILHKDEGNTHKIMQILQEYECEMILDEMMLFLKDKLLKESVDFPPLILERFARILSESKILLNLNTDGAFVLLLCTMKMQEALKVKDIESMIEELEEELFGTQNHKNTSIPISSQSSTPPSLESNNVSSLNIHLRFDTLVQKIKDRNVKLGEIFERNVKFVSFEGEILRWQSIAQGQDKEQLKEHFSIIKALVAEIFGSQVSIQVIPQATSEQNIVSSSENTFVGTSALYSDTSSPLDTSTETKAVLDAKDAFLAQNKDLISAIKDSVGIKEVIMQDNQTGGNNE
ncbi:DNA polymerase III subunit gamma/tau [Helicobacter sp. MIT 21-1697]|uniref:DNA polymerase III subunit gamma/tau n=1 Tax=Helicobacter sp. MIT 21-1697 TaxID=2993733 RepID=UPI00224BA185|nr:DNA polymerase III subunit gamma/tau [Helicobacter sp. MIT 21-1697]MCX2717723.1 DNA polymerase III subunit gamma/tau [Helicobacter sp. MIT 21-1697]